MSANQARLPRMTSEEMIQLANDNYLAFCEISAGAGHKDPNMLLSMLKAAVEKKGIKENLLAVADQPVAKVKPKPLQTVKTTKGSPRSVHNIRESVFGKIGAGLTKRNVFGDIRLDAMSKRIFGQCESVRLTEYEFVTFWLVIRGQGNLISQSEVAYFIYEEFFDDPEKDMPIANVVDVLMCRVRKKLSLVTDKVFIEQRHGYGYSIEYVV